MGNAPRSDVKPLSFVRRLMPDLESRLSPNERLLWVVGARPCDPKTNQAKLVDGLAGVTETRLILTWKALLSGFSSETKLLSDITTVEFQDRAVLLPLIRVAVAGDTVVFLPLTGDRIVSAEFAQFLRRMSQEARNRPATPNPVRMTAADRLRDLGRLKDEGLISESEFEAKKRQLLSEL